jgi:RNA polymerase sigma factor (sigma-70 family)
MHNQGPQPIPPVAAPVSAAGEIDLLTDRKLLRRFASRRDEAAFAVLVHRHGALVWRVCRTVLGDVHAAEDAFQATFLILVRKAGSIGRPELLANWLYGVAYRVALRARKLRTRREVHEQQGEAMLAAAAVEEPVDQDLQPLLQEELQRLPAKYRAPMVLCYLEGQTNEEAARQLRWPLGTLKVRLLRGREMLRSRLVRRGLALSAVALTTALSAQAAPALPAALLETTLRAAVLFAAGTKTGQGDLSAEALRLTNDTLRHSRLNALKFLSGALILAGLIGAGVGWLLFSPAPTVAPVRTDLAKLQGRWVMVAVAFQGQAMEVQGGAGTEYVVKGDTLTMPVGAGVMKLDPERRPKTLDLLWTQGEPKGTTCHCIYELDGDDWKICISPPGAVRPSRFETTGTQNFLQRFKRAADDQSRARDRETHSLTNARTPESV